MTARQYARLSAPFRQPARRKALLAANKAATWGCYLAYPLLLLVLAMLSTDDTRIYSASLTITQDVIVPLCGKPLRPESHIRVIRLVSIGVGVFFC